MKLGNKVAIWKKKKRDKVGPIFHIINRINFKCIKDLNVKKNHVNIRRNISDF